MTSEAIVLWTETSSDPELIAGVRAGDSAAFGVLYERHVGAARKVAAQYTNTVTDIDDVVSESFSRVLRALQRGDGPDLAFRAYLFTIVRRTGMDIIDKAIRTKPRDDMSPYESAIGYEASSDEPALDEFEHGVVADAFKSLPERWQAVLWYTEVEKKNPKEIAPLLGLSANGVAALAYRAREALRQAYLQQHLNTSETKDCLAANAQLGAYVRGGLSKREHAKVDAHVQACDACRALVAELADVNRGMRGIIAPLFMGVIGVGALDGGMPIGGALGPHGAGVGGAGAGGATGTAGGTASLSGSGVAGAAGIAGATSSSGTGTGVATGVAGFFGAVSQVALPAAAVVGVTALAIGGASLLGWFSPDSENRVAVGPGATDVAVGPLSPDSEGGAGLLAPQPVDDTTSNTADAVAEDDRAGTGDGSHLGQSSGGGSNGGVRTDTVTVPGGGNSEVTPPGPGPGSDSSPGGLGNDLTDTHGAGGSSGGDVPGGADVPPSLPTPTLPDDSGQPDDAPEPEPGDDDQGGNSGPPPRPQDPEDDNEPDPGPPPPATRAALNIGKSTLDYLEISRTAPHVSMSVDNTGDAAADNIWAQVTLPAGLEVATPSGGGGGMAVTTAERIQSHLTFTTEGTFVAGDWECTAARSSSVATCTLEHIDPGAGATLTLDIDIVADELAEDAVTVFEVAAGDITESYEVHTGLAASNGSTNPLDPGYANTGGEAVAHFGGTVMGCAPDPQPWTACYTAMTHNLGSGQNLSNNDWNMVELKPHPHGPNHGVTTVTVPDGATVKAAYLEWSANRFVDPRNPTDGRFTDGWTSDLGTAQVRLDTGDFVTVVADEVSDDVVEENRQYYLARADVTTMLADVTNATMTVADVAVASSRLEQAVHTYYGGFTLTVVYEHPDVAEDTRVALFEGPHWVKGSAPVTINFHAQENYRVTPSWTAYEGDRANSGDRVRLGTESFVPLAMREDGTIQHRNANDAADSWANGSQWSNTLGIDANSFAGKILGRTGVHSVTASTDGDNFMIGTFALTIAPPATNN